MSAKSEALPGRAARSSRDGAHRRRDFLHIATAAVGAVGIGAVAWPFIDAMNPSSDVLALSSIEVDLGGIEVGQRITVKWRGKPVFVVHRTEKEIAEAEAVDLAALRDPQSDAERVQRNEWLVVVGVCTHLGCIPLGQKDGYPRGDWGGWLCPCHFSYYDTSGRVRKGPAPRNLEVPQYVFLDDTLVKIG